MPDNQRPDEQLHILHLEDDPADAELIRLTLRADDRSVRVAHVTCEADFRAALETARVDLVLSDYSVPGFEGPAALALARELCPHIPFIIVSGALDEDTAIGLVRDGATDYVLKSRLRRLAPAVHRVMREARERQARQQAERHLESHAQQQAAIAELGLQALSGLPVPALMEAVAERVGVTLKVDCTAVLQLLPDGEGLRLMAGVGWPAGAVGTATLSAGPEYLAGYTLRADGPVLVADLPGETRFTTVPLLRALALHSSMTVIIPGGVQTFGVLAAFSLRPRAFSDDEAHFLQAASNVLAEAIARTQAEDQLTLQVERMALLAEAAQTFAEAGPDYSAVLNAVTRRVADLIGDGCTLRLLTDDEQWLPVAADAHRNPETLAFLRGLASQPLRADDGGVASQVVGSGHSRLVSRLSLPEFNDLVAEAWRPYWERFGAHSLVAVPLWSRGRVIGVMVATRDETPAPYTEDDQHLLRGLADRAALAIENAGLYEAAQQAWGASELAAERAARLQTVTAQLAAALTPDQVGAIIVKEGASALATGTATLQLLNANGQYLEVVNASSYYPGLKRSQRRLTLDAPLPYTAVIRSKEPLWLESHAEVLQRFPLMAEARLVKGYEALAVLPMTVESRAIGSLAISFAQPRSFSAEDRSFLITLAGFCAQAVERARLYAAEAAARAAAEQAAERTTRLQAVTARLSTAVMPGEVAAVVVEQSRAAMGAQGVEVHVVTPDGEWLERLYTLGSGTQMSAGGRIALTEAVPAADCVHSGQPLWLETHAAYRELYPQWGENALAAGIEALAVVPLVVDNEAVGALALTFSMPRVFGMDDQAFLLAIARQCGLALERARLYEAERQSRREAEQAAERTARLQMVTAALAQAVTPEQVTAVIIEHGVAALGAAAGSVAVLAEGGTEIEVVQASGYSLEALALFGRIPIEAQSPVAEAIRTGEAVWIESAEALQARYPSVAPTHADVGLDAAAAVPITLAGRTAGALSLSFVGGRSFDAQARALILAMTQQCAQALERARLFAQEQQLNQALEERVRERTEQLRALTVRLESLREDERARIAREVHDELGGAMTAIKMDLSRLARRADQAGSDVPAALADTIRLIDSTIQTVRRIATDLRPALLDDFGLPAAIEWQAQEFARRTGIRCELDIEDPALALDQEKATALFRVFQETLTNVARHAAATQVVVSLSRQPDGLVLALHDNGRGFRVAELARSPSLGLAGMRERVFSIAGELDIQSEPGQGTTVTVRLPLDAPPAAALGSV